MFDDYYRNKRVLVTGHTGFKGSWLTTWLKLLDADVTGYSTHVPTSPSNFELSVLERRVRHVVGDVRDLAHLDAVFQETRPQVVFHLAAQPIVRVSYEDPKRTFDTNVGGSVNVLECARNASDLESVVMITSDKCYYNMEWPWGYRETDRLGGKDPYSASKAAAELAIAGYAASFFNGSEGARVASARSGNVIGGGDWASDRVVPDCIRAWIQKDLVRLRNPHSTRPWLHVLEPLSGYLWLGVPLGSGRLHGEAFNFGPSDSLNRSVLDVVKRLATYWEDARWEVDQGQIEDEDTVLLKLSCDKALALLGWHAVLGFEDCMRLTAEWYRDFSAGQQDMYELSSRQIEQYAQEATQQGLAWAGATGRD